MVNIKPDKVITKEGNLNGRTAEAVRMGVKIPEDGYWGNVPSKICGAVGGAIGGDKVKKAIEEYEKELAKSNGDL